MERLLDVRQNVKVRDGHEYENWTSQSSTNPLTQQHRPDTLPDAVPRWNAGAVRSTPISRHSRESKENHHAGKRGFLNKFTKFQKEASAEPNTFR
ncbi:hypothetical protein P0136_09180 [Lentisphaerota bacterium ZTH]|nr:hypothetical protein JYG24_13310 [Lentisphaerota bacterium]WET05535.1 hypothetical protein P0136_09180 [Lentisphaerota bacterium ZTH]